MFSLLFYKNLVFNALADCFGSPVSVGGETSRETEIPDRRRVVKTWIDKEEYYPTPPLTQIP